MSFASDICKNIIVPPLYDSICWFNAIIISCFYSQKMRNLMINKISKTWEKSTLFNTFKQILKLNYKIEAKEKLYKLYDKIKPELILLKLLAKFNPELFNYFKIVKNTELKFTKNYITNFLDLLNVNYLDIIYYDSNEEKSNSDKPLILFNFLKHKKARFIINDETKQPEISYNFKIDSETNFEAEKRNIQKIIDNIPDVLILNHTDYITNNNDKYDVIYNNLSKQNEGIKVHNADNYGISEKSIKDISNYENIINFFGNDYHLDSVILGNYNIKNVSSHVITGLHCNNNRYIYNGWINPTTKKPCSLIKFNWNLKETNNFTLNTKDCKLNLDLSGKHHYSFNKGSALLIYVRNIDETSNTISVDISKSPNLSSIQEIITEYYDLNNLNEEKIKVILKRLKINFTDDNNYDDLEEKLFNKLVLFYYYKDMSKLKLIEEIKKIKPDLKELDKMTKKNLNQILKSIVDKTIGIKRIIEDEESQSKKKILKKYS